MKKAFFVFLLFMVVLVLPNVEANYQNFDTKTLSNGIKVVYKTLPAAKTVTTRIVVPVGFLMEPRELRGVSHLIEHLIYHGNENYPAQEFHHRIDDQGGYYNGFTKLNLTEYIMEVPEANFISALELYLDIILHPGFSDESIRLEKKIVTVEKELRTIPGDTIMLYLNRLTQEQFDSSVQNFSREDIVNYYHQYYYPQNLTVIVTGSFKPDDLLKCLSLVSGKPPVKSVGINGFSLAADGSDIELDDYLMGEKYQVLYGFELGQLSGKELLTAKVLPGLLEYIPRNFDYIRNKPLDYQIYLMNLSNQFYLIFSYRDCQDQFSPEISKWHQKNIERYFKFLSAKNFDNFLDLYAKYLAVSYEVMGVESDGLNQLYAAALFDPTIINPKDIPVIRQLSSKNFKDFVVKKLEGKPYRRVVVKAI